MIRIQELVKDVHSKLYYASFIHQVPALVSAEQKLLTAPA